MSKKFQKHFKRMRWEDFPDDGIVTAYIHLPNGVTPVAYQCVGKRDMRNGSPALVMLELCFELDIERKLNGQLLGSAMPLPGRFATGVPSIIETNSTSPLVIAGHTFSNLWSGEVLRFSIPESSHHLTNPAGRRFLVGEKKPQE